MLVNADSVTPRKHTGERPFSCHCGKQFSRLDNLRQHAQTVHADKQEQNELMMRELTALHTSMAAAHKAATPSARGSKRATTSSGPASQQQQLQQPTVLGLPSSSMTTTGMGPIGMGTFGYEAQLAAAEREEQNLRAQLDAELRSLLSEVALAELLVEERELALAKARLETEAYRQQRGAGYLTEKDWTLKLLEEKIAELGYKTAVDQVFLGKLRLFHLVGMF